MNCKLCGLDKKLIKAHIIPEFMYQDLYNEEHKFYEFSVQDIMDGKKLKPFTQIGEFAKNIKELRQVIETETNKQTQLLADNQKTIKISVWIIGGLTLILSTLAVFKLWT